MPSSHSRTMSEFQVTEGLLQGGRVSIREESAQFFNVKGLKRTLASETFREVLYYFRFINRLGQIQAW